MWVVGGAEPLEESVTLPVFQNGSLLNEMQRRGHLRVGVMFDVPNFSLKDPLTGAVSGMEADMARVFAQHVFGGRFQDADQYVEFVEVPTRHQEMWLAEHALDMVMANYADTATRRKRVSFAGHYMASRHAPLVHRDMRSLITSVSDLNGLTVAVGAGSTDVDTLAQIAPRAVPLPCPSATACIAAVMSGRAQAYWTSSVNSMGYIKQSGGLLCDAPFSVDAGERWAVGLPKGDALLSRFTQNVVDTALSSTIIRKWIRQSFVSAAR